MRNWLPVAVLAAAVALATAASAQSPEPPSAPAKKLAKSNSAAPVRSAQSNGHVYLLRGLLNIFSLGMDDLASKIQAKGISASVHNHSEWQGLADEIAAKHKARAHGPVILVGHSLGADAVMYMAEYLGKKGVPVALVVPFDGTGSFAASSNVGAVMNLTQRDYAYMRKGSGFRGQLANIDVSKDGYGHIDIDKSARLHAMVLTRIQTVIRTRGGTPAFAGDGAPAPRARPAAATAAAPAPAPAVEATAAPAATTAPATAAVPAPAPGAADSAPKPPVATTASTNASANVVPERSAAPAPAVSRPATVPAESSANRTPAASESGAKPALRF